LPRPAHQASATNKRQREEHAVHDQRDRIHAVPVGQLDDDGLAGKRDGPHRQGQAQALQAPAARARLKAHRLPVAPRVAGRDITFHGRVTQAPDELAGAVVLVAVGKGFDPVTQVTQALRGGRIETLLRIDRAAKVAPSRRIAGGLRVLLVVQHAHQGLQVALRLHVAAHHAKAHHRLAVLGEESRDDGVEGPLAGTYEVVAGRIQREAVATVLQAQAVPGTTTPEPKPM
jgi:hypothetical protein